MLDFKHTHLILVLCQVFNTIYLGFLFFIYKEEHTNWFKLHLFYTYKIYIFISTYIFTN